MTGTRIFPHVRMLGMQQSSDWKALVHFNNLLCSSYPRGSTGDGSGSLLCGLWQAWEEGTVKRADSWQFPDAFLPLEQFRGCSSHPFLLLLGWVPGAPQNLLTSVCEAPTAPSPPTTTLLCQQCNLPLAQEQARGMGCRCSSACHQ